jgi:outer membrane murein-binding lipoprotein Lpp
MNQEATMLRWCKRLGVLGVTALLSSVLLLAGCEGTESRNRVDDTVEELAGKKQVDQMKAMKEDLEQIQTQQADRIKQLQTAD